MEAMIWTRIKAPRTEIVAMLLRAMLVPYASTLTLSSIPGIARPASTQHSNTRDDPNNGEGEQKAVAEILLN